MLSSVFDVSFVRSRHIYNQHFQCNCVRDHFHLNGEHIGACEQSGARSGGRMYFYLFASDGDGSGINDVLNLDRRENERKTDDWASMSFELAAFIIAAVRLR